MTVSRFTVSKSHVTWCGASHISQGGGKWIASTHYR